MLYRISRKITHFYEDRTAESCKAFKKIFPIAKNYARVHSPVYDNNTVRTDALPLQKNWHRSDAQSQKALGICLISTPWAERATTTTSKRQSRSSIWLKAK